MRITSFVHEVSTGGMALESVRTQLRYGTVSLFLFSFYFGRDASSLYRYVSTICKMNLLLCARSTGIHRELHLDGVTVQIAWSRDWELLRSPVNCDEGIFKSEKIGFEKKG